MRRGLLALGCLAFGAAATSFAACGGNAAGICDFNECSSPDGGGVDATSTAPDGNVLGDAGDDGTPGQHAAARSYLSAQNLAKFAGV